MHPPWNSRSRFGYVLYLTCCVLVLLAPALWNGCPLWWYGDSTAYLLSGRQLMQAILHPEWTMGECRSVVYGLMAFPLHWDHVPWGVVAVQSICVIGVLELSTRRLRPDLGPVPRLLTYVVLTALTPLGWIAGLVAPDVFVPVALFGLYWLGPGQARLTSGTRLALGVLTGTALCCHPAVLLLGWCGYPVLAVMQRHWRSWALGCLVLGTAAQVGANALVYRQVRLFAPYPPALLARLVADGLAQRYLAQGGDATELALYPYRQELPQDHNAPEFLFDPSSFVQQMKQNDPQGLATIESQQALLALGILRHFPLQFGFVCLKHWVRQLITFQRPFGTVGQGTLDTTHDQLPALYPSLVACREAHNVLGSRLLVAVDTAVFVAAIVAIGWFRPRRMLGQFSAWVVFGVILNAGITGVLSGPEARYQARVAWLIPYLAMLCWMKWHAMRGERKPDGV